MTAEPTEAARVSCVLVAATQVIALAFAASPNSAVPASANRAVPALLSEALAEYGCLHIADDAEVLQNRGRWWVSLKPFTGGDADFVFYCQAAADKLRSRLILVVRGENNPWGGCDAVVDSWQQSVP